MPYVDSKASDQLSMATLSTYGMKQMSSAADRVERSQLDISACSEQNLSHVIYTDSVAPDQTAHLSSQICDLQCLMKQYSHILQISKQWAK